MSHLEAHWSIPNSDDDDDVVDDEDDDDNIMIVMMMIPDCAPRALWPVSNPLPLHIPLLLLLPLT